MTTIVRGRREPVPISMEEAVGYSSISCRHDARVEGNLVLKYDRLFCLLDPHGNITPPGACGLGLFQDDTRMLSRYELHAAGGPPVLLSAQIQRMFQAQIDLAVTDTAFGGDPWSASNRVHLRREIVVDDVLTERVTLTSFLSNPIDYWVEIALACDFADIFEVRGWTRRERGEFFAPVVDAHSICYGYRGRDGRFVQCVVVFPDVPDCPPRELTAHGARWTFRLEPHTPVFLQWRVVPTPPRESMLSRRVVPLARLRAPVDAAYAHWASESTRWASNVDEFNLAIDRAVMDLRALYVESDGMPIISAGIPWYSTPFGRDSIITSIESLCLNPQIAVDTLHYLARHQGEREDPYTEEQPGKIMHELRRGEMARAGEIPHVPYYGTVDATPLWLILLHETWRWTGDEGLVRSLLPNAERALEWIDRYGDLDGDGFVEYARTSAKGLVNQGWKDSWDGIPYPDGRLPEPPIALVEVQGYVYDAKRRMAALYDAFGQPERAETLRTQANTLREAIVKRFWLEDAGIFALALDGEKRPLPTVTTNAGHLLWSRVADASQAARLARRFLEPDMFSGWGIRTLSASHAVYNPMSYHDGSVWPHDNAIVALGLSLYEHRDAVLPVFTALADAANGMEYHRLPELFCGMERAHGRRPVLYPVSCSPQAWASGAFFMLLQAVTGLFPDAPARMLHIREPLLPPFLQQLVVHGLRIGQSRVALRFTRRGTRTLVNLLEVEGDRLQVRIELT